jgi:hypothetical protein
MYIDSLDCISAMSTQPPSNISLASEKYSPGNENAAAAFKTPPPTPKNVNSDDDEDENKTSDTTHIKYPALDMNDLAFFNTMPPYPLLELSVSCASAKKAEIILRFISRASPSQLKKPRIRNSRHRKKNNPLFIFCQKL